MRILGPRWKVRGAQLLPLAGAIMFHMVLLVMILSWKPPPLYQPATPVELSLVSGVGRLATAAIASPIPEPPAIEAKSALATAKQTVVAEEEAANPGSPLLLKPSPTPLSGLALILAQITARGPSLTAEPIPISPPSVQTVSASVQPGGSKNCEVLEALKLGLQGSDAVRSALLKIPTQSLSVAKAIVLWDGDWIDARFVGGESSLQPIEQAVSEIVNKVPANCQVEPIQGVRFITLGDARDTTVLAFGSNDWRWADVVATVSPIINK